MNLCGEDRMSLLSVAQDPDSRRELGDDFVSPERRQGPPRGGRRSLREAVKTFLTAQGN